MKIDKVTFKNNQYILEIQQNIYIIDEYVYKLLLPYDGKQIDKKQFEMIVAFSNAHEILKNLYKKIFQHKISQKNVYQLLCKQINEFQASIIISTLKEDLYLNDHEYAKYLIDKNHLTKGKKEIENILIKEKINYRVIQKELENFEENGEFVQNYIKQKYKTNNSSNKMFVYKIKQQLLLKGFSEQLINKEISRLELKNDNQALLKDLQKLQKKYDNPQKIISKLLNKGYNVEDIKLTIRKGEQNE